MAAVSEASISVLPTVPICPRCSERPRVLRTNTHKGTSPYKAYCKQCDSDYNSEYRAKNKERLKEYQHGRAVTRWQEIKADPKRHLAYLEDIRIYRRLRQDVVRPRTPIYTAKSERIFVDKGPIVREIKVKLDAIGTLEAVASRYCLTSRTLWRVLYQNRDNITFWLADEIATAFGQSVYNLYPELLDD